MDIMSNIIRVFIIFFLVVVIGENGKGFIFEIFGFKDFNGDVIYFINYKFGFKYQGKNVLVVGCGNLGMEIVYDFFYFGVNILIVIRNLVSLINYLVIN